LNDPNCGIRYEAAELEKIITSKAAKNPNLMLTNTFQAFYYKNKNVKQNLAVAKNVERFTILRVILAQGPC
jgi:hypothetical protein